jgi:hypothetical protein
MYKCYEAKDPPLGKWRQKMSSVPTPLFLCGDKKYVAEGKY